MKINRYSSYSVSPAKGLRIIILNSNYCYRYNLWNYFSTIDPGIQLHNLVDQLIISEKLGEKVLIASHLPLDLNCLEPWLDNFIKIINRFKSIITIQINGHEHQEGFRLYYFNSVPINIAIIGPSITPWSGNNPGYKVYYLEPNGDIQNHKNFWLNLTDANDYSNLGFNSGPDSEKYGLYKITPEYYHKFIAELNKNEYLFQNFMRY